MKNPNQTRTLLCEFFISRCNTWLVWPSTSCIPRHIVEVDSLSVLRPGNSIWRWNCLYETLNVGRVSMAGRLLAAADDQRSAIAKQVDVTWHGAVSDAGSTTGVRRELVRRETRQPQRPLPAEHLLVAMTTPVNARRRISVNLARKRDVIAYVSGSGLRLTDKPWSICIIIIIISSIRLPR